MEEPVKIENPGTCCRGLASLCGKAEVSVLKGWRVYTKMPEELEMKAQGEWHIRELFQGSTRRTLSSFPFYSIQATACCLIPLHSSSICCLQVSYPDTPTAVLHQSSRCFLIHSGWHHSQLPRHALLHLTCAFNLTSTHPGVCIITLPLLDIEDIN